MEEKLYSMDYEVSKNVFHISVTGFFKEKDGLEFLKEYNDKLNMLNVSNTNLIVEAQNLKTSTPEMAETVMKQCFMLYSSSGFKRMIVVLPNSPTSSGQAKRVATSVGFKGEFVTSLDEAYSLLT